MLAITINDKLIQASEGATILQTAIDNGIPIPHFCYHKELSIAAVCRLCFIEIEGMPKLQLSCNTKVTEGMKIRTDSPRVKETQKWSMQFHLINHPLDCPTCDQSGECKLQDYYMQNGLHTSALTTPKVLKKKIISISPHVMLDQERCVLCSRCVRFLDEYTKTNELGIFDRGDRSCVSTHDTTEFNNAYSLNIVDSCPVGALTSKDFRFKCRVWFLSDAASICTGCSTGCNTVVQYRHDQVFSPIPKTYRVLPRYNESINRSYMCDEGRFPYRYINKESRLQISSAQCDDIIKTLASDFKKANARDIGVVFTPQLTNEEITAIFEFFYNEHSIQNIFRYNETESASEKHDGLLIRGDKNPNSMGLKNIEKKFIATKPVETLFAQNQKLSILYVVLPENTAVYPNLTATLEKLSQKTDKLILLSSSKLPSSLSFTAALPIRTYIEKDGSFTNYAGITQTIKKGFVVVPEAKTVSDILSDLRDIENSIIPEQK